MIKRVLIGLLAFVVLATTGVVGYGWWTRRGAPSFSQGGAFGEVEPTLAPVAVLAGGSETRGSARRTETGGAAAPTAPAGAPGRASTTRAARGGSVVRSANGVTVAIPATGTYRYDGSGSERVNFGGASPCSWDIKDVTLSVGHDGPGTVVGDWTFSSSRLERHISSFTSNGWYTNYVGAAVTCLGVRRTEEASYEPHARRLAFPLRVGETWSMRSAAGDRSEQIDGEILRTERITVPAGTFDTYVVHLTAEMSGNSQGIYETTMWFSPALGLNVKQIADTNVSSSGAAFTSKITLALRSTP